MEVTYDIVIADGSTIKAELAQKTAGGWKPILITATQHGGSSTVFIVVELQK